MAFVGYLELFLQFHSLRNVDLFHQGLYQLRAHVYRELPRSQGATQLVSGEPTKLTVNPLEAFSEYRKVECDNTHFLAPPTINPNRSFTTRTFQIRFCDEEVELNDGCVFRIEVDLASKASQSAPIYIELDLKYAESPPELAKKERRSSAAKPSSTGTPQTGNTSGDFFTSPLKEDPDVARKPRPAHPLDSVQFVDAAYQVLRIENPLSGISEYFQVNFDQLHFCVAHCTVHTSLIDIRTGYRYNPKPPLLPVRLHVPKPVPTLTYTSKIGESLTVSDPSPFPFETPRIPWPAEQCDLGLRPVQTFVEHLAEAVSGLDLPDPSTRQRTSARGSMTSDRELPSVRSVEQINDLEKVLIRRADLVYHEYFTLLVRSYYRIRVQIETLSARCFSPSELEAHPWLSMNPSFYLPGKLVLTSRPNGLPEPSATKDAVSLKRASFTIPAHLCVDAAGDMMDGDGDPTIAGATRTICVPYLPPSARLSEKSKARLSLSTELQNILSADMNLIWSQTHELWEKLRRLLYVAHKEAQFFFAFVWESRMAARCREVVFLEVHNSRTTAIPVEPNLGSIHQEIADQMRQSRAQEPLPRMTLEDVHCPFDIQNHPIVFEERYCEDLQGNTSERGWMERRTLLATLKGGIAETVPKDSTRGSMIGLPPRPEYQAIDDFNVDLVLSARRTHETHPTDTTSGPAESSSSDSDSVGMTIPEEDEPQPLSSNDWKYLAENCPVFISSPSAPKTYDGLHLIVLVHGFQGNSMDMRVIKNQFSLVFPEGIYLLSSSNEEHTEGEISALGKRLADEVRSYVADLCPGDSVGRVSFVSHSLGGLIVRSALPHLKEFHSRFHLFLTLSSPHMGYLFAKNKLVDAGFWVLKKWKKSSSLQQLSMGDARDLRHTFLYKLSQLTELRLFTHVVFVSCYQDQYIPYESARVEIAERIQKDPIWGPIHTEMVTNILSSVHRSRLTRLDVCFKIIDRSLDSFIGRTAHIHFLGSQQLAQTLAFTYPHWFS